MKLANVIKLAKIRSIIKMEGSDDEAVEIAAKELKDIERKYVNSIGLRSTQLDRWRTNLENIEEKCIALKKEVTEKWKQQITQG